MPPSTILRAAGGALANRSALRDRAARSRWSAPVRLAACLTMIGVVASCHSSHTQTAPLPQPVTLVVHNQGFFDVNVYVMQSASGTGIRLATVTGNTSATMKIPPNDLQLGYVLVLRLHAIGSRYWWDTPSVTMDAETIAHLDITSDPDGNLSRSSLYTSSSDTTGGNAFEY